MEKIHLLDNVQRQLLQKIFELLKFGHNCLHQPKSPVTSSAQNLFCIGSRLPFQHRTARPVFTPILVAVPNPISPPTLQSIPVYQILRSYSVSVFYKMNIVGLIWRRKLKFLDHELGVKSSSYHPGSQLQRSKISSKVIGRELLYVRKNHQVPKIIHVHELSIWFRDCPFNILNTVLYNVFKNNWTTYSLSFLVAFLQKMVKQWQKPWFSKYPGII